MLTDVKPLSVPCSENIEVIKIKSKVSSLLHLRQAMVLNAIIIFFSLAMTKCSIGKVGIETEIIQFSTWCVVRSCVLSSAEDSARHPKS